MSFEFNPVWGGGGEGLIHCHINQLIGSTVGRFPKHRFFFGNETIVLENDQKTKRKTITLQSFSKTRNNPNCIMYKDIPAHE